MNYVHSVAVINRLAELEDITLYGVSLTSKYIESISTYFQNLEEVLLNVLKYKVKLPLSPKSFFHLNYILILQLAQDLYFPYRSLTDYLVLFSFFEFLYGDDLPCLSIFAFQHYAVSA